MIDAPKIIDQNAPRSFCNDVLGKMSKRDRDDLVRIQAHLGEIVLLRMTAARYMDPYFVFNTEMERICKRFGSTVEAAYQTMIAEIEALNERRCGEQSERDAARAIVDRANSR